MSDAPMREDAAAWAFGPVVRPDTSEVALAALDMGRALAAFPSWAGPRLIEFPAAMGETTHLRFQSACTGLDQFLASLAPHVARGGMFVPSAAPLAEGTPVTFEFSLPDLTTLFAGDAVVVACRQPGGSGRPGMLLRFTSLLQEDLERLERAVAMQEGAHDAPLPAAASPGADPAPRRSRPSSGPEPALGIDFGATCCRASVLVDRSVRALELEGKSPVLPSAVAWDDRGRLMLGSRARAQQAIDPRSALVGFRRLLGVRLGSESARALTTRLAWEVCADGAGDAAARVRGRAVPLVEAAACLLAEVRNRASVALGQPVRHAVLTAPQLSTSRQKQALRLAAHLAGLTPDLVVSDPVATATFWCHRRGLSPRTVLVFDLGGSSFAASLLRLGDASLELLGTVADREVGGDSFDARLAQHLEQSFQKATGLAIDDPLSRQRVRDAAEAAKVALSREDATVVHVPWAAADAQGKPHDLEVILTREQADPLVADLASRAVVAASALCKRCQVAPRQLDEVLLVGAQSQWPVVRLALVAAFGDKVAPDFPPTGAVAGGAAIAAWSARLEPRRSGPAAAAALAESLHLRLADQRFHQVVERGALLPCERSCSVAIGPQGLVRLSVWQSDERAAEPAYLGSLFLRGEPGGQAQALFQVSRSGVLTLTGCAATGGGVLFLPTASLTDEGRRELEAASPMPEPSGRDRLDPRKLLGLSSR